MPGSEVRDWEKVLGDNEELRKFYTYLQTRKRTIPVDFWVEVETYKRLPRQQRKEQANAIAERYLETDAPYPLSSSAEYAGVVPTALETSARSGRLGTSLFDQAQSYALHVIVGTELQRFRTSKAKPSGTAWKRTEQTLALESYLRSASKRRECSERSEEPEQRERSSGRDRKKPRGMRKRSNREHSTDANEKQEPSEQPKSISGGERKTRSERSKERILARSKEKQSSRSRDVSAEPTDPSPATSPHSMKMEDRELQVCTSRDGGAGLPDWLAPFAGNAAGVKRLEAVGKGIGADKSLFEELVAAIAENSHAEFLDVSDNALEDRHVGPLLTALQGSGSVSGIDLANNCITDAGAEHIVRWLESQAAAGGSELSYISLYGNCIEPAAELRVWRALRAPEAVVEKKAVRSATFQYGHKKSRSVDLAANTLPINAVLCKKARTNLMEVLSMLEAAQAIVNNLPDNLQSRSAAEDLHCPEQVLAALQSYDSANADHGPSFQPPGAIELLHCITSTRVACLFDGMQGELSWLPVPGEHSTSSELYMHEKTIKQLQQMEALEYHPYVSKHLFHYATDDLLLFFTGNQGVELDEIIREKMASRHGPIEEDTLWIYNIVTIVESIAASIQFMRSHEVMISLPTRHTVHVIYEMNKRRVSKSVLGGVHTVASRLHNMATADLRFIAPELLKDIPAKNVSKADVFSMGVVLWEMLRLDVLRLQMRSKDSPAPARRLRSMMKLDADGTSSDEAAEVPQLQGLPDADENPTSHTFALLEVLAHQCTDPDPTNRPTLREVQEKLGSSGQSLRRFCATPRGGVSRIEHAS
mmetsp:Transcript_1909/g.6821  ORF Transcript_1909/g.6821 Transcript_1909/m.6821 type:complete len:818 (-) Transcript_1909:1358-3811(-)